jgi:hypothetical protein
MSSFNNGEIKNKGIAYFPVWLEHSYDLPEGVPGQDVYTLVICRVSFQRLSHKFQFSLSSAALGIYLYGQSGLVKSVIKELPHPVPTLNRVYGGGAGEGVCVSSRAD